MGNVKMHSDEIDIDTALVKRLVTVQFPMWADLTIEPVSSSGTENALYKLGNTMVIRLPRHPGATKPIDKELHWLPRLSPFLPVSIPKPIAKGEPGEDYPWSWSIYEWLEGANPVADQIDNADLLVKELAKFISALRQIDTTNAPQSKRGVPLVDRDAPTRKAIGELGRMIDTDEVTAIWEKALQIPEYNGSPVWLHGDLMPGNLLCKEGRLTAVIDFGSAGIGDPSCDLIVAWNLLPANTRNLFCKELQADEATWERGRGWALSIALIQLPYYKDTNPALAANARHVIREVLTDYKQHKEPSK